MISDQLVDLSRLQFAATALYHFLFVPRFALWRWVFSGWACTAGLWLAAWLRRGF